MNHLPDDEVIRLAKDCHPDHDPLCFGCAVASLAHEVLSWRMKEPAMRRLRQEVGINIGQLNAANNQLQLLMDSIFELAVAVGVALEGSPNLQSEFDGALALMLLDDCRAFTLQLLGELQYNRGNIAAVRALAKANTETDSLYTWGEAMTEVLALLDGQKNSEQP